MINIQLPTYLKICYDPTTKHRSIKYERIYMLFDACGPDQDQVRKPQPGGVHVRGFCHPQKTKRGPLEETLPDMMYGII